MAWLEKIRQGFQHVAPLLGLKSSSWLQS